MKKATANGKAPFLRVLTGDAVYNGFSEGYRTRLKADDTWIQYEFNNFGHYRPTDEDLAQVQKPVAVLYGADSPPFFGEAANWLSEALTWFRWAPNAERDSCKLLTRAEKGGRPCQKS